MRPPLFQAVALLLVFLCSLQVLACANCTNESPEPIEPALPPWTLKGTVYSILLVPIEGSLTGNLPVKAYGPLERRFPSAMEGDYAGILGMIQIIRYTEGPVGPYDELLIIPGFFNYERAYADGNQTDTRVRVSRIYVSQKYSAWNGRVNWNIPKHLAKFDWTDDINGTTSVKIYPYDTTGDLNESYPASKPFFQMSFQPALFSNIPFSTDLYGVLGVNTTLAQPPLPSSNDTFGALAGTSTWKATVPGQFTDNASTGIFDLNQGAGDIEANGVNIVGDEYYPNFWPGLPRYNVGLKLENATITFSAPEVWQT